MLQESINDSRKKMQCIFFFTSKQVLSELSSAGYHEGNDPGADFNLYVVQKKKCISRNK